MFKTCKVCGETKDAVHGTWVMKHNKPDGRTCRQCANEAFRARISTPEGRLKSQEYSRTYLQTENGHNTNREYTKQARSTPEGRQKHIDASLAWQKKHAGRMTAKSRAYKLSKINRTPPWLTADDYKAIEDKYVVAQWFSYLAMMPYHVDHIVPLNGVNVSGLHVPSNLCVKLGRENLSKGNKWVS